MRSVRRKVLGPWAEVHSRSAWLTLLRIVFGGGIGRLDGSPWLDEQFRRNEIEAAL